MEAYGLCKLWMMGSLQAEHLLWGLFWATYTKHCKSSLTYVMFATLMVFCSANIMAGGECVIGLHVLGPVKPVKPY